MPLLGQASGGWTEGSSALRLLYVTTRNSLAKLTDDAFTQRNPAFATTHASAQVDQTSLGVLSGSVTFSRPDQGADMVGGVGDRDTLDAIAGDPAALIGFTVLGVFINNANGNAFENTPGQASGLGPYVSGQGTCGNALYETKLQAQGEDATAPAGHEIEYISGMKLIASVNGFLMPSRVIGTGGAIKTCDNAGNAAEVYVGNTATVIGIVKMPPDAVQNELVYDQRI